MSAELIAEARLHAAKLPEHEHPEFGKAPQLASLLLLRLANALEAKEAARAEADRIACKSFETITAMDAQLKAAQRDSERLDWFESRSPHEWDFSHRDRTSARHWTCKQLRAAIDAAMAKEPK